MAGDLKRKIEEMDRAIAALAKDAKAKKAVADKVEKRIGAVEKSQKGFTQAAASAAGAAQIVLPPRGSIGDTAARMERLDKSRGKRASELARGQFDPLGAAKDIFNEAVGGAVKGLAKSVLGNKTFGSLSRLAGKVEGAMGYLSAGYDITKGILDFTTGGGAERREQLENVRLAELDPNVSPLRKEIARRRARKDTPGLDLATMDVRDSAGIIGGKIKSMLGIDDTQLEEMQTTADVRDSGLALNPKAVRAEARRRRGGPMGEILDTITPDALKRETAEDTKVAQKMIQRASTLDKKAYEALGQNNFALADAAFKASAQAVGSSTWKNARTEWPAMDAARASERMYVQSQNPMPPLRIGE